MTETREQHESAFTLALPSEFEPLIDLLDGEDPQECAAILDQLMADWVSWNIGDGGHPETDQPYHLLRLLRDGMLGIAAQQAQSQG